MVSVAKPRCARGQNCSHIRDFPHIDIPPKVAYDGALCDRCRYNTNDSEVPEEYKELFRTAKALFDNDVGDEDEILPTLVFAGNWTGLHDSRVSGMVSLRRKGEAKLGLN
jgi:hypothetical protein